MKDRKKKMAIAPMSLFSLSVLPPKKLKTDFNNPFSGFSACVTVVISSVELSAILYSSLPSLKDSLDLGFGIRLV
jgi:hypothetical protein